MSIAAPPLSLSCGGGVRRLGASASPQADTWRPAAANRPLALADELVDGVARKKRERERDSLNCNNCRSIAADQLWRDRRVVVAAAAATSSETIELDNKWQLSGRRRRKQVARLQRCRNSKQVNTSRQTICGSTCGATSCDDDEANNSAQNSHTKLRRNTTATIVNIWIARRSRNQTGCDLFLHLSLSCSCNVCSCCCCFCALEPLVGSWRRRQLKRTTTHKSSKLTLDIPETRPTHFGPFRGRLS